jgi:hypothetical protein
LECIKEKAMPQTKSYKDYYTASEVKEKLGITDGMLYNYVRYGHLERVIPPGRKQGVYPKRGVDNLANKLHAFLAIDSEGEEEIVFRAATEDDMLEISNMGRAVFVPTAPRVTAPAQWHLDALGKNPEISFVLKRGDELLGYVNTVPFTVNNEKVRKCLTVDFLSDVNIIPDDIETYEAGKHIHLYIMAVCINPSLKKTERRKHGATLITRFISKIKELGARGVTIEKITARGDTPSGVRLLQAFGFSEAPSLKPGTRVFIIDMDNSYGDVSTQYKEALAQWKEKHS